MGVVTVVNLGYSHLYQEGTVHNSDKAPNNTRDLLMLKQVWLQWRSMRESNVLFESQGLVK